jgi:hypothetical protein
MTTTPVFRALLADDAYAASFQSMGQYRTALLKALATPPPEPPTDEEIEEWAEAAMEVPLEEMDPDVHGWRRCFTKEEFWASIRAALERWGRA